MLKLIIEDDEGRKTVVPFVRDEITVGRQEGNTIRLTERNVSRRHARLLRQDGSVVVEDLGSYNGIRVNGEKVVGRAAVADGDLIQIGDYDLAIQQEASAHPPPLQNGHRSHVANGAPPQASSAQASAHDEPETEAAAPVYQADKVEDTSPSAPPNHDARRQSTSIIRVDQVEATRPRQVAELDVEEAPRLVVVNTEFAGREFACIRTELRIGRTDDNDITLDHRSLSRTHAKLVRENSGEWRVVDMQSANGLQVNGEPYAQATLNNLDVIELGHLKLRFIAAGESYTYSQSAEERAERRKAQAAAAPASKGGSKTPLFLGVGAVVVLGLAAGGYFLLGTTTPETKVAPEPMAAAPKEATPTPAEVAAAPGPAAAEPSAKVAVDVTPKARALLDGFAEVLGTGDLAAAAAVLDEVRALGELPKALRAELDGFADRLAAEQAVPGRLDLAEKALAADRLAQAEQYLEDTEETQAFALRHATLSAKLSDAQAAKEQAAAAAAAPSNAGNGTGKVAQASTKQKATPQTAAAKDPVPSGPTAAERQAETRQLVDEGTALLNQRQNKEAKVVFARCLEVDPKHAKCHLLIGATYARLGEVEQGAKHYERFLVLAPNASEAEKVRTLLDQYKQSKKSN